MTLLNNKMVAVLDLQRKVLHIAACGPHHQYFMVLYPVKCFVVHAILDFTPLWTSPSSSG